MIDAKILIAGVLAAFLLMGNKKDKKTTTTSSSEDSKDSKDSKSSEEGKGGEGDPAGPNGCKEGLKEKEGICVPDPNAPKDGDSKDKGGTISASSLIIPKDCKSFKFGDKTGEAWWKAKGQKVAKQWIKSGYTDLIYISYEMLKGLTACYKEFPIEPEFKNWFELEQARFEWISKYRAMWQLLWFLRNKIDVDNFNGMETVTAELKNGKLILQYGKGFNQEQFWMSIKGMALTILQFESMEPGSSLGLQKNGPYNELAMATLNTVMYVFTAIFPNIAFKDLINLYVKNINAVQNLELFEFISDKLSLYDNLSIDPDQFDLDKD